jgi:AcrR family transcriptional regulator
MPRNKYPEETVKKILDASLKLFIEKGYEETTILDIVDNLGGMTRGAFYHHFKSKEDVLNALMKKVFQDYEPLFNNIMHEKNLSGLEKIKTVLKASMPLRQNRSFVVVSTAVLSLLSNPRFMTEHVKGIQRMSRLLAPVITEGMTDGSISRGNPKILAELFILLFNFWLVPSIYPCNKEEILAKIAVIKQTLDSLGFPVIDDDIQALLGNFVDDNDSFE